MDKISDLQAVTVGKRWMLNAVDSSLVDIFVIYQEKKDHQPFDGLPER